MNKAFIFDMDGVIVDSERTWDYYGEPLFIKLLGKEIREKIGDTRGVTPNIMYERAVANGFLMRKDGWLKHFDEIMVFIYKKSKVAANIEDLAKRLTQLGYTLGLVSSSRLNWINMVLPKLKFRNKLKIVISVNDRTDLSSKYQAYLEAIEKLGATPKNSIVLEDSNLGIESAKKAGAYVIGFQEFLVPGYIQSGADIYAANIEDVIKIV